MLSIDISQAVFLYLLSTVVGIFVMWIFFEERMKFRYFREDEAYIWQCSICAYTYVDSINTEFSRCPRCNSINTKGERRDTDGNKVVQG